MKRAKNLYRLSPLISNCDPLARPPEDVKAWSSMPDVGNEIIDACDHVWERDGQTMTSVRWYCAKCKGSMST